jgi:hypothetical protein
MTHRFLPNKKSHKLHVLIDEFLHKLDKKRVVSFQDLVDNWPHIVGEHVGHLTKPLFIKQKVFYIAVKNATLYSLLNQYEKKRLTQIIKEKFPHLDLAKIVFKMG